MATDAGVVIIGSSDGIGLALARLLLSEGHRVVGISRSPSPIDNPSYTHHIADINKREPYRAALRAAAADQPDTWVYCAGIGEPVDFGNMAGEAQVFDVNLTGAVVTAAELIPGMVKRGRGHIVALSSLADHYISPDAPSYAASKAGLSSYLQGLALALRPHGVHMTNVRFGFVDTKMAKASVRPFMITADKAAQVVQRCLRKRPIRCSYPLRMAVLMGLVELWQRLRY